MDETPVSAPASGTQTPATSIPVATTAVSVAVILARISMFNARTADSLRWPRHRPAA